MPKDVDDAYRLDEENGNNLWAGAINKERSTLYEMDCFSYHEKGYKPDRNEGHQWTRVHMIFDVKTDLRRNARLVAGGHLLELFDSEVYSSTVKGISVKLLHVLRTRTALW